MEDLKWSKFWVKGTIKRIGIGFCATYLADPARLLVHRCPDTLH